MAQKVIARMEPQSNEHTYPDREELEMPPVTMYDMHPVDGMLRLQAIVDAIRDILETRGPTSRDALQTELWDRSLYTANEIDAALCNVDHSVDKHDILTAR